MPMSWPSFTNTMVLDLRCFTHWLAKYRSSIWSSVGTIFVTTFQAPASCLCKSWSCCMTPLSSDLTLWCTLGYALSCRMILFFFQQHLKCSRRIRGSNQDFIKQFIHLFGSGFIHFRVGNKDATKSRNGVEERAAFHASSTVLRLATHRHWCV